MLQCVPPLTTPCCPQCAQAEGLKKGASAEAVAQIDAAVAGLEKKSKALADAVKAGKADAGTALDEALSSLSSTAGDLQKKVAASGVDDNVKALTGESLLSLLRLTCLL